MKRLNFPVDFSGEPVAEFRIDEIALVKRLGVPHVTSDDSTLFPSPVALWAYELGNGVRVVVEFYSDKRLGVLACDPPDPDQAIDGLGLSRSIIVWRRGDPEPKDAPQPNHRR